MYNISEGGCCFPLWRPPLTTLAILCMERFVVLKTKSLSVRLKLLFDLLFRNRIVLDMWSILESMNISIGDLRRFDVSKKKKR